MKQDLLIEFSIRTLDGVAIRNEILRINSYKEYLDKVLSQENEASEISLNEYYGEVFEEVFADNYLKRRTLKHVDIFKKWNRRLDTALRKVRPSDNFIKTMEVTEVKCTKGSYLEDEGIRIYTDELYKIKKVNRNHVILMNPDGKEFRYNLHRIHL